MFLLFPGRHLLNTNFQMHYLLQNMKLPLHQLKYYNNRQPQNPNSHLNHIIFAVTSSNQEHSRYNPIPFYVRSIALDRFGQFLKNTLNVQYSIFPIPHFTPTQSFASHMLKIIHESTEGDIQLNPNNTVVLSSTQPIIEQFDKLGFSAITAELNWKERRLIDDPPVVVLTELMNQFNDEENFKNCHQSETVRTKFHPTTISTWMDFPEIPKRIFRLWKDPLLNDSGSLTDTRNYENYAWEMSNEAIISLKWNDIKNLVKPGKIVDEGCADGSLLVHISREFPSSDLIGIDIANEFISRCKERQRAHCFGNSFIHFHQRNILDTIFGNETIDTTICNSTIHELWSYGNGEETVKNYFKKKYNQTRKGGRIVIRDVVGPEDKEQIVYMWLNSKDGNNEDVHKSLHGNELANHLNQLSTYSKFKRFVKDFKFSKECGLDSYTEVEKNGEKYIKISLKGAAEFMMTKDYTQNWESEMQEEFTFWSFSQWKFHLQEAGFEIIEDVNYPTKGSRVYTNPWIVENRYKHSVELYKEDKDGNLTKMEYPPTNIILVGEKN